MEYTRDYIASIIKKTRKGEMPIPENMDRATAALFWENRLTSNVESRGLKSIYNLSTKDHNGTLSMYQIYMQCDTEYDAALVLLGSLSHWRKLCECKWFVPHVEAWREDMAIRDQAIGRAAMIEGASKGNYAAGKALVTHTKVPGKRGRPAGPPEHPVGKPADTGIASILERAEALKEGMKGGRKLN